MGRRLLLPLLCLALVPAAGAAAAGAAAAGSGSSSWASAQIRAVTAAGLLGGGTVATFHPDDPLSAQALENLVFELKQRLAPPEEPVDPVPPVATEPWTTSAPGTTTAPATTTATTTTAATTTATSTAASAPKQAADPGKPVTIATLDARLVGALGPHRPRTPSGGTPPRPASRCRPASAPRRSRGSSACG